MSLSTSGEHPADEQPVEAAALKLEVVVIPVADVDRAKEFYAERLGWRLDADFKASDEFRVVQVTPPGSPASVIFGQGITSAVPGSVDSLILVVTDIDRARTDLVARGVDASATFHDEGGVFHHAGTKARVAGPDPQRRSYGSWVSFSDPDGNGWLLQEITTRLPGR
jgi:catechol 2,3-dioxygenase-like lactoylglutathione lyase family enzyme